MTKTAMQLGREGIGGRPEVKPHQCQQCLKSFSSNHQLVQHIRSVTVTLMSVQLQSVTFCLQSSHGGEAVQMFIL